MVEAFGKHFDKTVIFKNKPEDTALLNDASESYKLFGKPSVSLTDMIQMTANWVKNNGAELSKPTHFQERKGAY